MSLWGWCFLNITPDSRGWAVYFEGPEAPVTMAVEISAWNGTVSSYVDSEIVRYSIDVTTRVDFVWQEVYPAVELTTGIRGAINEDPPISKSLYVKYQGRIYSVMGMAAQSQYESYSSTIDTFIASFRLTK